MVIFADAIRVRIAKNGTVVRVYADGDCVFRVVGKRVELEDEREWSPREEVPMSIAESGEGYSVGDRFMSMCPIPTCDAPDEAVVVEVISAVKARVRCERGHEWTEETPPEVEDDGSAR